MRPPGGGGEAMVPGARAQATPTGPSPHGDSKIDELLPTRIEPIAHIDTNEFKAGRMTRKVEKWFQNAGRPVRSTVRSEGREWIDAIDCGFKRRDEYEAFDVVTLSRPHGDKPQPSRVR